MQFFDKTGENKRYPMGCDTYFTANCATIVFNGGKPCDYYSISS